MRKHRTADGQNGVAPEASFCGQLVATAPLSEIAVLLGCESPAEADFQRLPLANGQEVLVLDGESSRVHSNQFSTFNPVIRSKSRRLPIIRSWAAGLPVSAGGRESGRYADRDGP